MSDFPRLTWIVVDGLPLWLLDRFRSERARLPTLSFLHRERRIAGLRPVSPNCQTPPSLFSLFSGTPPVVHGLAGFDMPDLDDPIATRNGFETFATHIPMIWDRYAAAGRPIRLCQVPYVDAARLGHNLRASTYGFGKPIVSNMVLAAPASGSRHRFDGIDGALEIDEIGQDSILLRIESDDGTPQAPVLVKAGEWRPLHLRCGLMTIVGFIKVDGVPSLVLLGAWSVRTHGDATETFPTAPFIGGGLGQLYRQGRLGRIAIEGGDGAAELALFGAIRAVSRRFWAEALDAQGRHDADLVIAYQPACDLLFHEILGLIDRDLNRCTAETSRFIETLLLRILCDVDAALAALSAADGTGRLIVSSDHGMKAVDTVLLPNVILRDLGLLTLRDDGRIDAVASAAFYHPAETGLVCIAAERLQRHGMNAEAVMTGIVDGLTRLSGRPCDWFTCHIPGLGPRGFVCSHYLSPGRGQTAKATLGDEAVKPSRKSADHATVSADPQLIGVVADLSTDRVPRWPTSIAAEDVLPLLLANEMRTVAP
jgi:Type I phosphodiesterase / nucleotide pyrophosphatase